MLQQTRTAVVVDYFLKWMQIFPSIESLASAKEEEVIKAWEGLGYYSRARNLHAGAKQVITEYGGELPDSQEMLLKIKGIGPYTAGAILSFAFGKKAAALDGNVKRVLARYLGHEESLQDRLMELLPEQEPNVAMEGLIELGATLCGPKPICDSCPLASSCVAKRDNLTLLLPRPKKRPEVIDLYRFVACIECEGFFLLKRASKGKIMEGLWEFPYIECKEEYLPSQCLKQFECMLSLKLTSPLPLKKEKHHFTRYRAHLFPFIMHTKERKLISGYEWKQNLKALPFSSGHRRILKQVTY